MIISYPPFLWPVILYPPTLLSFHHVLPSSCYHVVFPFLSSMQERPSSPSYPFIHLFCSVPSSHIPQSYHIQYINTYIFLCSASKFDIGHSLAIFQLPPFPFPFFSYAHHLRTLNLFCRIKSFTFICIHYTHSYLCADSIFLWFFLVGPSYIHLSLVIVKKHVNERLALIHLQLYTLPDLMSILEPVGMQILKYIVDSL